MADLFLSQQNSQQPYFNSLYLTTPLYKKPQSVDNVFGNPTTQNVPEIKNESVFTASPKSNAPQTPVEPEVEDSKADGLAIEIKGYYVLTEEAAKKRLAGQLSEAKTPEAQQKEFERLVATGMSKRDASILAGTLGSLDKGVQVSATQTMLDNKNLTPALKTYSDNKVVDNLGTLHTDNQIPAVDLVLKKAGKETKIKLATQCYELAKENQIPCTERVIATKDGDIIKAGASTASRLDVKNQTRAVGLYQRTGLSAEQQKEIDKTLISQYGEYAKENQVDIHKIMSSSQYTETVELAAGNIYKFDKSNQVAAFQVTMGTQNEAAIKAASSQYSKYDDSVRADIKTIIQNSQYESAKAALVQAEQEAQVKAEAQAKAEAEAKTEKTASSETKTSNVSEKIEAIKTIIASKNTASLEKSIINMNPYEQIALLRECPNNNEIIKILIQNSPSLDVLAEIERVQKDNGYTVDHKTLLPQLCFLSSSMQNSIMVKSAANNDLGLISRTMLNTSVRADYDKLAAKQRENIGLG